MTSTQHLRPHEFDLAGEWVAVGDGVEGDAIEYRIRWLTENCLVRLGADESAWDVLYRDPDDGRLWELTHPQSELHGAGPSRLTVIAAAAALHKYRIDAV